MLFRSQADGDRRLADHVLGIVATNPTQDASQLAQHDRLRGTAAGYLPAATLRPLALNLAAAVSWGAWTPPRPPVDLPDQSGSRPWRKAVNTGAFRRAERAGAYARSGSWTSTAPLPAAGPTMPKLASRPEAARAPPTAAGTGTSTDAALATTGTTRAAGSHPGGSMLTSVRWYLAARSITFPYRKGPP